MFWASGRQNFMIDNRGVVHALVMMWVPKDGPESLYAQSIVPEAVSTLMSESGHSTEWLRLDQFRLAPITRNALHF
jgi:hypothetical protein